MKIDEIKNEGLSREYKVNIPYDVINAKVEEAINERAKTFKLAGFREGKVPLSLVKQKVGSEITSKEVQKVVSEAMKEIVENKEQTPSSEPKIEVQAFDQEKGLVFNISFDILPAVPEVNWKDMEVELIDVEVLDEDIEKMKDNLIKSMKDFKKASKDYKAKKGDALVVDFIGKVDGKDFEGNKAEGLRIIIDSKNFIPGFEDQLIGLGESESKKVKVKFPKDYFKAELRDKDAVFDVKVNEVFQADGSDEINDELLKKVGVKNVEELNEAVAKKLNADFTSISRMRTKKVLFDQIDKNCNFDVPEEMVEIDFKSIWEDVKKNKENSGGMDEKEEKKLKEDYKKLSKRRVKIGLVLANVARENKITVSDQEVQNVIGYQISQNPDNKDKIMEFYKDAQNLEKIKAPIIEEKSLDLILKKTKIKELKVTSKEFNEKYSDDIRDLQMR